MRGPASPCRPGNGLNGWSNGQILSLLTSGSWANNTLLGIDTTNGNSTYSGNIPQALSLTKLGANTLTLSGSISAGPMTVNAGAVNILSASPSIGGLSGGGGLVLGNATGPVNTNLTVNSSSNSIFSGIDFAGRSRRGQPDQDGQRHTDLERQQHVHGGDDHQPGRHRGGQHQCPGQRARDLAGRQALAGGGRRFWRVRADAGVRHSHGIGW